MQWCISAIIYLFFYFFINVDIILDFRKLACILTNPTNSEIYKI
jgi:hypothetical protein